MRRQGFWIMLAGLTLLTAGCGSDDAAAPGAGGGGGGTFGSADSFTNTVAQSASAPADDQEPSDSLAQMVASAPEDSEPANI